jgi:hypothetical protein
VPNCSCQFCTQHSVINQIYKSLSHHQSTPSYTKHHPHTPAFTKQHTKTPSFTKHHPHTPAFTNQHKNTPSSTNTPVCTAHAYHKKQLVLLGNNIFNQHITLTWILVDIARAVSVTFYCGLKRNLIYRNEMYTLICMNRYI